MREFDYSKLKDRLWNNEILIKVANIHEAKGRQELYLAQKPEELNRLVEIAKIQSTEASNAIEGIRTTDSRLKQLVSEKTTPRNRNEKEIAGYRDALSVIHDSFEPRNTQFFVFIQEFVFLLLYTYCSVNFLLIFFCLSTAYVSNYYQVYIKDIKSLFSLPYVCYNIDRWYPL